MGDRTGLRVYPWPPPGDEDRLWSRVVFGTSSRAVALRPSVVGDLVRVRVGVRVRG